jgi:hypothetical protein
MAITPSRRPASVEEFISGAPDAGGSPAAAVASPAASSPVSVLTSVATPAPVAVAAPPASPVLGQTARRRPGIKRGRREQISHTIDPDLLDKVDRFAREMGQTRAGFINMAIFRAVQAESDKR